MGGKQRLGEKGRKTNKSRSLGQERLGCAPVLYLFTAEAAGKVRSGIRVLLGVAGAWPGMTDSHRLAPREIKLGERAIEGWMVGGGSARSCLPVMVGGSGGDVVCKVLPSGHSVPCLILVWTSTL